MSKEQQDEIRDIVIQLQRLHLQESELLKRLERLNEADNYASNTPITTREFVIGDVVQIKNPRPLQAKKGTIIRIVIDTNRITVQAKNGSKIIRAPFNLAHIS
jgi:ribosomal protein S17